MQIIVDSLRKKGKLYKKMQEIAPKRTWHKKQDKNIQGYRCERLFLGDFCYKPKEQTAYERCT